MMVPRTVQHADARERCTRRVAAGSQRTRLVEHSSVTRERERATDAAVHWAGHAPERSVKVVLSEVLRQPILAHVHFLLHISSETGEHRRDYRDGRPKHLCEGYHL